MIYVSIYTEQLLVDSATSMHEIFGENTICTAIVRRAVKQLIYGVDKSCNVFICGHLPINPTQC